MAGKYYAVRKGLKPGIYNSWPECQKQITGFSGAVYKSFKTVEEANGFMKGLEGTDRHTSNAANTHLPDINDTDSVTAVAYVDGSYNVATNEFSYGMVMFYDKKEYRFSCKVEDESLAEMRNVAGEIKGAEAAMIFAVEHNCKKLSIFYDYEGIARWCLGDWKTNKEGTRAYKEYYDRIKEILSVEFIKVKGHSQDKYNDLADQLAKDAIM